MAEINIYSGKGAVWRASFWSAWRGLSLGLMQWWILSGRCWKLKKEDRWYLLILILQAPLIGLLLVLVFYGCEPYSGPLMFALAISALWFGVFSAIREIVSEQAIYQRERMINLNIVAYVFSKLPVLFTISLIQCVILLVIVYPLAAMNTELEITANILRFASIFFILILTASTGTAFGLMLSALSLLFGKKTINRMGMNSSEVAMTLIPLALLPQIILGGPFVIYEKAFLVAKIGSKTTILRWSFSALLNLEASGPMALARQLGMRGESMVFCCAILLFFWVLSIAATMGILKLQEIYIYKN